MVDFSQVKSAETGSEGANLSYFRSREAEAMRAIVDAHPDVYFKLAVVASRADLQMLSDDFGVTVLPEQAKTINGVMSFIVARAHQVNMLVDAFAGHGDVIQPYYITPLAPYALTGQGLWPVHLSTLKASQLPCAPQMEEPSRIATSAFETALMRDHPHIAFVFEATSGAHTKQALSRQVDDQLFVFGGVLHEAQVEPQGVLFVARRDAAESVAKLADVSVELVRPLKAFASQYVAGGELLDLPRIEGRPQFVSVPVSNGRISVLKLSQGAN